MWLPFETVDSGPTDLLKGTEHLGVLSPTPLVSVASKPAFTWMPQDGTQARRHWRPRPAERMSEPQRVTRREGLQAVGEALFPSTVLVLAGALDCCALRKPFRRCLKTPRSFSLGDFSQVEWPLRGNVSPPVCQSPGRSGPAKGQLPSGAKVPGHGEQWVWGREGSRCSENGSEYVPVEWAPPSPHPLPKLGSLTPGLTRLDEMGGPLSSSSMVLLCSGLGSVSGGILVDEIRRRYP